MYKTFPHEQSTANTFVLHIYFYKHSKEFTFIFSSTLAHAQWFRSNSFLRRRGGVTYLYNLYPFTNNSDCIFFIANRKRVCKCCEKAIKSHFCSWRLPPPLYYLCMQTAYNNWILLTSKWPPTIHFSNKVQVFLFIILIFFFRISSCKNWHQKEHLLCHIYY